MLEDRASFRNVLFNWISGVAVCGLIFSWIWLKEPFWEALVGQAGDFCCPLLYLTEQEADFRDRGIAAAAPVFLQLQRESEETRAAGSPLEQGSEEAEKEGWDGSREQTKAKIPDVPGETQEPDGTGSPEEMKEPDGTGSPEEMKEPNESEEQEGISEAGEEEYPEESIQEEEQSESTPEKEETEVARRTAFTPHEKAQTLELDELEDYETLVKNFYTIDPTTMAGSDQLNVKKLSSRDMTIEKTGDGPQILIYHTHSQEGFLDSVAGEAETTIVGVGEELADILREEYGYQVYHHTGEYDKPSRDGAYTRALPKIEEILEEYPSIRVVIDLHRDEMPEKTRLVTEIDGKKTAKFMFFNGLSRTKRTGNLDYLYNAYLEDNLAFSFQMEKAAKEYYPDLTRKIYLKGYRYNMHLCARTLLIELGAQNNTLEEALNACGPLAHLLDLVLQGKQ